MANLGQTFDPTEIPEDERSFDLIPSGQYEAQIVESEIADTKRGDGKMLNLTLEITSGQFERRKLWDRVNIVNPSAEAQRIGQRRLADYCEATGAGAIQDSEQLHYKPMLVTVGVDKDKTGEYPDKNKITRVKALAGRSAPAARPTTAQAGGQAQSSTPAAPTAATRTASAPAASARPWGQKRA